MCVHWAGMDKKNHCVLADADLNHPTTKIITDNDVSRPDQSPLSAGVWGLTQPHLHLHAHPKRDFVHSLNKIQDMAGFGTCASVGQTKEQTFVLLSVSMLFPKMYRALSHGGLAIAVH